MKPASTDDDGPNEHAEDHAAACTALLRPSDNHRLAVSERAWLHCDPGHPRPQVFDALSDSDTECVRIDSPPWSDSKRLHSRFGHACHGIGGRSCLVRRYKGGFLA